MLSFRLVVSMDPYVPHYVCGQGDNFDLLCRLILFLWLNCLLGEVEIWQNWPSSSTLWWNTQIKVDPTMYLTKVVTLHS